MAVIKLTSTDAFVVVDLDDAPRSTGAVRSARKILRDGAASLARSLTYTYACFGLRIGGASGGINAEPDDLPGALEAFVGEAGPIVRERHVYLGAGKGVPPGALAGLHPDDPLDPFARTTFDADLARGVVEAITAVRDDLSGIVVAVERSSPAEIALLDALHAAGATVSPTSDPTADCDVLCLGSKPGIVDHDRAADLRAAVVVPTGPMPLTTRAVAVAARRGVTVLPDFVTTAGPHVEAWQAERSRDVASVIGEAVAHPDGPVLGACRMAEDFLLTWRDDLPFGRPI